MNEPLLRLPLGGWIEAFINFMTDNFSPLTRSFSALVETFIKAVVAGLGFVPPWLFILIVLVTLYFTTTRKLAAGSAAGLLLIWSINLWPAMLQTLAMVVVATLIATLAGIPIGILGALYPSAKRLIVPVLDFMQTMPAFVYLIPAIPFFGMGVSAAVFATVVFSIPPAIRLTILGIEQIPAEIIEAADAFGSNTMQKLLKVQLPLARKSIMAGVNQTIMLALSMVVIAAMIGAKGLGGEVWKAIQRLRTGMGFEAGIAVVIMAMILDRITQRMARTRKGAST